MSGRKESASKGANVGYEAELWQMADALRDSVDAAKYKHVALGQIFLKYISDAFENLHAKLGDSFHNDRHPDLKADNILANPSFNVSVWGGERLQEDKRWKFGAFAAGNAHFAWVQHIIHDLAPTGLGEFVLAKVSESTNRRKGNGKARDTVRTDAVSADAGVRR